MFSFLSFVIVCSAFMAMLMLFSKAAYKIIKALLKFLTNSGQPIINRFAVIIVPGIIAAYYYAEQNGSPAVIADFILVCCCIAGYCFYKFLKLR